EAVRAVAVHHELDEVLAGSELHAVLQDVGVLLEAAGGGDGQGAGDVLAVDLDVERAAGAVVGDAGVEVVEAGRGDVDGVAHPLAGVGVGDVVAAVGVGRGLDIDALARAIGEAFVVGGGVV